MVAKTWGLPVGRWWARGQLFIEGYGNVSLAPIFPLLTFFSVLCFILRMKYHRKDAMWFPQSLRWGSRRFYESTGPSITASCSLLSLLLSLTLWACSSFLPGLLSLNTLALTGWPCVPYLGLVCHSGVVGPQRGEGLSGRGSGG